MDDMRSVKREMILKQLEVDCQSIDEDVIKRLEGYSSDHRDNSLAIIGGFFVMTIVFEFMIKGDMLNLSSPLFNPTLGTKFFVWQAWAGAAAISAVISFIIYLFDRAQGKRVQKKRDKIIADGERRKQQLRAEAERQISLL